MSYRGKLKRYWLILKRLQQAPSMAEIIDHLNDHGFEISQRTVERDLEDLRDDFGVEVVYNRPGNSYGISEELTRDLPGLMHLLDRVQLLELVQGNTNGLRELHRFVHFEGLGQLRGIQHLEPLLQAIRLQREVRITYKKFSEDKAKVHRVKPHQLREFHGRWYVLGPTANHTRPIALGLDRMEEVEVTDKRFKRKENELDALYTHSIGVDTSPDKPEQVVLHFHPQQAPYVKALPLHPSQVPVKEDARGLTVSLHVMVNFELRQIILGHGRLVKVIAPKHLAANIRKAHREAAAQYK
ncbi:MAG TPA: WYL domain-containing protein [Flavobacteriales bacterium]|nr:WYL domain-containing protein [Flavobacteriales bacterium]